MLSTLFMLNELEVESCAMQQDNIEQDNKIKKNSFIIYKFYNT